jgi:hypothetical protein
MAISLAVAALMAASSAVTAGASIYGAKKQAKTARESGALQSQAADKERAYLEAKDKQDRDDWLRSQEEDRRQFDETQDLNLAQWNQRQAQLEPYRQASNAAGQRLSEWMGLPAPSGAWNTPNPPLTRPSGGTGTSGGGAPGGTDPKIAAFIRDWQASHSVSEGIAPLAAGLQAAGFSNVGRYMYGDVPSDNELSIGGQKYKVLGAEKTANAYWYKPGMDDSAPGRSSGAPVARAAAFEPSAPPSSATLQTFRRAPRTPALEPTEGVPLWHFAQAMRDPRFQARVA